ncbi:ankyrin and het domain [Fusarium albosuccineum]|uniref:Ankyrin and het domain n=1 Tax=Fusarium albosuccineum TaxID=1237068 RepID=A0A8H4LBD6_9HYPO|nr:ankyrin and het domain [Fusarium albosuccineum]
MRTPMGVLLESTSNLFRRKPNREIKKPIKSIKYLVTSLKTFNTGNTQDLIYSLMSITSDTSFKIWHHDNGNDEREILVMDYNKSEVAVYQDFTKFYVRSSKSLDVIYRPWAMPRHEKGMLPSWIPLLVKSEFGEPEDVYTGRKNGDNLVGPARSSTYEASGKSQCDAVFKTQAMDSNLLEAEIIIAKGFKLAKVHKLPPRNTGKEAAEGVQEEEEAGNVHEEEEGQVQTPEEKQNETQHEGTPDENGTSQETENVITGEHRTDEEQTGEGDDEKCEDHASGGHEAAMQVTGEKSEDDESNDENEEVTSQVAEDEKVDDEKVSGEASNEEAEEKEADDINARDEEADDQAEQDKEVDEESVSEEWNDKESVKNESSEPDVREDGGADGGTSGDEDSDLEGSDRQSSAISQDSMTVLGLCPPETKEGDFICILYGCSVPVVLRETPDKRQMIFVGEAYVHGKMDGEAMEDIPDRTLETFYIE